MPKFIADFHIHSKYSRATSRKMDVENLNRYAKLKGIKVLGTGDFTFPKWIYELKTKLQPFGGGLFKYKETFFILTAEVSNDFLGSDGRRKWIHNIIFAPSFEIVERINKNLKRYGILETDGRPKLALTPEDLVKLTLDISEECLIVPAHVWTPWFSLFGANSGFDSVHECFGKQTDNIYALETGLSSDPPMNWRLSSLDEFTLISNSDSHSPAKIGREANVFNVEMDYKEIINAIKNKDREKFLYTTEFFPQEGKYHYDGHRKCNLSYSPGESQKGHNRCPVCKRKLTIGVLHRVEELADRDKDSVPPNAIPYKHLVPLPEIISEALEVGVDTSAVKTQYERLIGQLGSEFDLLLELSQEKMAQYVPRRILEGIMNVRNENVEVTPGYDGVYGKIKTLKEKRPEAQRSLFDL